MVTAMRRLKSQWQFLIESVDEELRCHTGLDGRAILIRGWNRYNEAVFLETRARQQRELAKAMPLLAEEQP